MSSNILVLFVFFLILAIFGSAAWAGLRAAPWLPTRRRDIDRLLKLANVQPGECVYDLGCGDGRVLTAAAQRFGANCVGFEISLLPYLVAACRVLLSPARKKIKLRFADFFHTSLNEADIVFCFLTPSAMNKLKTKFVQELKPGARVVSYTFSLSDLPGVVRQKPAPGMATAYLYTKPE